MSEGYKEHQSGMPDEDYFRMIAQAEYAWSHRMKPDPMEGVPGYDPIIETEPIAESKEGMPTHGTINFPA